MDRNAPMPSTGLQSGTNALPQDLGGRELGCDTARHTLWSRKCVIFGGNSEILSVFLAIGSARQKSRKKKGVCTTIPRRTHAPTALSCRTLATFSSVARLLEWSEGMCLESNFFSRFFSDWRPRGGRETLKETPSKISV